MNDIFIVLEVNEKYPPTLFIEQFFADQFDALYNLTEKLQSEVILKSYSTSNTHWVFNGKDGREFMVKRLEQGSVNHE